MAETVATQTPEVLSLQAHLDQLEAAIVEGHSILDRISTREGEEPGVGTEGAEACISRCQGKMAELNRRLIDVANRVGAL